jgi:ArsR family transcriptional regulator
MSDCACGDAAPGVSDAELNQHVERFKALSNPVRLRMVDLIHRGGGEICVCEFTEHFDLSQPTVSHHLKVLRDAGLIRSRRDGTFVYHRVVPEAFSGMSGLMRRFADINDQVAA